MMAPTINEITPQNSKPSAQLNACPAGFMAHSTSASMPSTWSSGTILNTPEASNSCMVNSIILELKSGSMMEPNTTSMPSPKKVVVAAATTTFLGLGMDVVLGSIIDPDLSSKMMEFTMQEFEASGVFKMVPEDQVEGMLADVEWAMKPAGQALSWALGLLFWGVISLIVGAIMKRSDPSQF